MSARSDPGAAGRCGVSGPFFRGVLAASIAWFVAFTVVLQYQSSGQVDGVLGRSRQSFATFLSGAGGPGEEGKAGGTRRRGRRRAASGDDSSNKAGGGGSSSNNVDDSIGDVLGEALAAAEEDEKKLGGSASSSDPTLARVRELRSKYTDMTCYTHGDESEMCVYDNVICTDGTHAIVSVPETVNSEAPFTEDRLKECWDYRHYEPLAMDWTGCRYDHPYMSRPRGLLAPNGVHDLIAPWVWSWSPRPPRRDGRGWVIPSPEQPLPPAPWPRNHSRDREVIHPSIEAAQSRWTGDALADYDGRRDPLDPVFAARDPARDWHVPLSRRRWGPQNRGSVHFREVTPDAIFGSTRDPCADSAVLSIARSDCGVSSGSAPDAPPSGAGGYLVPPEFRPAIGIRKQDTFRNRTVSWLDGPLWIMGLDPYFHRHIYHFPSRVLALYAAQRANGSTGFGDHPLDGWMLPARQGVNYPHFSTYLKMQPQSLTIADTGLPPGGAGVPAGSRSDRFVHTGPFAEPGWFPHSVLDLEATDGAAPRPSPSMTPSPSPSRSPAAGSSGSSSNGGGGGAPQRPTRMLTQPAVIREDWPNRISFRTGGGWAGIPTQDYVAFVGAGSAFHNVSTLSPFLRGMLILSGQPHTRYLAAEDMGKLSASHWLCSTKGAITGTHPRFFTSRSDALMFRQYAYDYAGLTMAGVATSRHHPPRQITLITRRITSGRGFWNQDEVIQAVRETGLPVQIISNLGDYAFKEQIQKMAMTGILIAAHGAALVNSMFLPAHAVVVEIFPYLMKKATYAHMASALSINHLPLYHWNSPEAPDTNNTIGVQRMFTPAYRRDCANRNISTTDALLLHACNSASKLSPIIVDIPALKAVLREAVDLIGAYSYMNHEWRGQAGLPSLG